jgi:acyl-CoA synthetase (AMP-forming)/AMP-acid ligase II
MSLHWIREDSPVWDADKARIVGALPTAAFSTSYEGMKTGKPVPGDWCRVEEDGAVVAYGWLDVCGDAEMRLAVAPTNRGRGVGSFVLEHLQEEARRRGFSYVVNVIPPTHPEREAVTAWFQKRGFKGSDGLLVGATVHADQRSVARETVAGLFLSAVAEYPERTFIRFRMRGERDVQWTYAQAASRVAATVQRLHAMGIRTGDRAICYSDEIMEAVHFVLACAHIGVAVLPVSPVFPVSLVKHFNARVAAKIVFTTEELAETLVANDIRPLAYTSKSSTTVHALDPEPDMLLDAALAFLRAAAKQRNPAEALVLEPCSELPLTAVGVKARIVIRSNRSLVGVAPRFTMGFERNAAAKRIMPSPLCHYVGYDSLCTALYLAGELVVPARLSGNAFSLKDACALDPHYVFVVPRDLRAFFRQYQDEGKGERFLGPSTRVVAVSGEPIMPELMVSIHRHGIHPNEYFASAESGLVSCAPLGQWRKTFTGSVPPEVTARVNEEGELEVKSPWLADGYYDDEGGPDDRFGADGFCRTGTFAEMMDGYLRIVGRRKDAFC